MSFPAGLAMCSVNGYTEHVWMKVPQTLINCNKISLTISQTNDGISDGLLRKP